jgi:hypothetical protein
MPVVNTLDAVGQRWTIKGIGEKNQNPRKK